MEFLINLPQYASAHQHWQRWCLVSAVQGQHSQLQSQLQLQRVNTLKGLSRSEDVLMQAGQEVCLQMLSRPP